MTPADLARLTRTCHDILRRNPAALAAVRADLAANPPASRELPEQPAGHAASAATSHSVRTRRPAATSTVEVL